MFNRTRAFQTLVMFTAAAAVHAHSQPADKPSPTPVNQQPVQTTTPANSQPTDAPAGQQVSTPVPPAGTLSRTELEQLLGPIALYPDTLLANVLAASVYPDEVKEAAAFVARGGDKSQVDAQSWEDPVKAVAKIPDVMKMMGDFPDWTTAMGQAYLTQSQEVMAVIQDLRKKAQANGTLRTTPQQTVVVEPDTIYIQSPDPEVVYVPSYQPSVVYVDDPYDDALAAGLIGFTTGIVVGAVWADLACDWNHGCVGWGWGHGDVDVDIDRNFNGNINIGNNVGNRVEHHRTRVGNEGNAWAPNRSKTL
ncbi:MAG: DUF3300 domain-containing protein, partial [Phycisphaerales bacterium]|nr:DUF3300 domain-containing protein [Phycisphaerales bacterium]